MKRTRFAEEQIIAILKEQEAGISVADLNRSSGLVYRARGSPLKSLRARYGSCRYLAEGPKVGTTLSLPAGRRISRCPEDPKG
jgi:hypothetical protein